MNIGYRLSGSGPPQPMPQLLQPVASPACTPISHVVLDLASDLFTYSRGTLCAGELAMLMKLMA